MPDERDRIEIRESAAGDLPALDALYPAAFADEDLRPLIHQLLGLKDPGLSLVAWVGEALAGHVFFTHCGLSGGDTKVSLLAPLAVLPGCQRKGVGSALVRAGIERLRDVGVDRIFVLGEPAYYGRFGFAPEPDITPPYPLPDEWRDAWQSVAPGEATRSFRGALIVPPPWREPALWAP